ncbi:hypothetical protein RP20_CCG006444 [Aedes albopictus]|nr:hypothetical protein RP20_CCG006444 [Aedes albopictus]
MNQFVCFLVLCFLCSIQFSEASYQCGIRQHGLVPLIKDGWQVEEGQWPWHVAVFNRFKSTDRFKYGCGGTLVNEKHTLTAAHCVKRKRSHVLYEIELHFGQHNLSKWTDNVVIRDVSKIHVHPEYEPNKNDIAVLVMRLPVEYSDTVIPICLDQKVHRDLRELEGKSGWVTGWGMTENGTISDVLRTTSLSVVSYVTCLKDDPNLYGKSLNEKVFCAGNNTGSSPGQGDSGGGMYISDGDRWQLRGIISFGKFNELMQSIDASKYIVFANVQWYLTWIKEIFAANEPRQDKRQKRISELECERFQRLTRKRRNGDCFNRYRHNHTDRSQRYDMAILKLNASVLFSNTLIPACLANNWTENLYDILVQTAFVTETIDNHMTLVESDENRISLYEKCKSLRRPEWFNRSGLIEELCVNNTDQLMYNAYPELTMSKSSGAVLQTSNRQSCISTVVGLKVHNEGSNEYPKQYWMEIYARIAYHLDWIEQSIWNGQSQVDAELPLLGVDDKCGIYHHDRGVEEWPWSTAIFHRNPNTSVFELICSGTLISKKHVLTTAQCVLNHTTGRPLPEDSFELHFGLNRLDQRSVNVQMRYVREVHIHPDTSGHNVAVLVTSWPIKNTPFVTYICTVPSNDSEFWNLEGQPAYITGWQTIETGKSSNDLKSSNVYFLDRQECFEGGLQLSSNQYCSDYPYECERFGSLTQKSNGVCENSWGPSLGYPPHVVSLHDDLLNIICLGVLVTENYILASCQCIRHHRRLKTAKISYHGMVNISDMMCHADYNSTNFQHDVGVLRLSTAVALSSQLVPACLGSSLSENLKDAMLQTTLFSDLSKNVRRWPHSTYYYIGKKDECDKLIQESHRLNPGQTCVINPSLETDKFNGSIVQMVDSRTCRFTVIGIGSTEFENPHISPAPRIGIVHRIDHYLDWIEQIVWKRSFQCGKARPLVATRLFKVSCV